MSILFTDIEAFVDNEIHIKCVEANVMGFNYNLRSRSNK